VIVVAAAVISLGLDAALDHGRVGPDPAEVERVSLEAVPDRALTGQMLMVRMGGSATPELVRQSRAGEIGGVSVFPPPDQPIDERKRGHRRHVHEQPSAVVQEGMQAQQEQVRRDEMLEQVRAEDTLEAAPEIRQAVLDVRERGLEAERPAEGDVLLDGVDANTTRPELHQVLAVPAADIQHCCAVRAVGLADEPDRA